MENKQLLKLNGSDSDEMKEFELPPARARRPKLRKAMAEAKIYSGRNSMVSFKCCVLFLISGVLCAAILLFGWMLMNMHADIAKLKRRVSQSESHSDLKDSRILQQNLKDEFRKTFEKDNAEMKAMKAKIVLLKKQINSLNTTIQQLKTNARSGSAPSLPSLAKDVKLLKKGMADTGGEIKKLADDSVEAKKTFTLLTKIVKGLKKETTKLGHSLKQLQRKPVTDMPVDTLKPLLATTIPVLDASEKQLPGKVSKMLKKVLDGYNELFQNKTNQLNAELLSMNKFVKNVNSSHGKSILILKENIKELQNVTDAHGVQLEAMAAKLMLSKTQATNSSSNAKIISVVNDIFVGLKKHQKLIRNLTARVEKVEKTEKPLETEKRKVVSTQMPVITKSTEELVTSAFVSTTEAPVTVTVKSAEPQKSKTEQAFKMAPKSNSTESDESKTGQKSKIVLKSKSVKSDESKTEDKSESVPKSNPTASTPLPHKNTQAISHPSDVPKSFEKADLREVELSPAITNSTPAPIARKTVILNATNLPKENGTVAVRTQLPVSASEDKSDAASELAVEPQQEHLARKSPLSNHKHAKSRSRVRNFHKKNSAPARDDIPLDRMRAKDFSRENEEDWNSLDDSAPDDQEDDGTTMFGN